MKALQISDLLFFVSFAGIAAFIPFGIAGVNISIFVGFLALSLALFAKGDGRKRYRRLLKDPMFAASLVLVVSALPSVMMSENVGRALRDWKSYWLLLVYFLVAFNLTEHRFRRALVWVLIGSMSLSCMVTFVQYGGGIDFLFLHLKGEKFRPGSTLYTMTYSGILYQVIALTFTLAITELRFSPRVAILGAGLIVQTASILITLTRGAWLALIGGLAAATVLCKRKRVMIAGAVIAAAVIVFLLQNREVRERVGTLFTRAELVSDENVSTRLVLWDISWELFKKNPIFGVGMGDYSIEAEKLLRGRKVTTTVDSHNIYLQVLATRGVFGFLPFVYFWFAVLRMLVRQTGRFEQHSPFGRHVSIGALAVTVAVLIGAVTENNVDDSEVFTAYLFIVAVARSCFYAPPEDASLRPPARSEDSSSKSEARTPRHRAAKI